MNNYFLSFCNRVKRKIIWEYRKEKYRKQESHQGAAQKFSQVTYYACGNAGDTVLSQCVRRTFEKAAQDAVGWNLIQVNKPVSSSTVLSINKTKALVIGGGGLFLPDTNGNEISGWQWAVSEEQLRNIDIPVVVYSVGYNYFKGQEPGELFKKNLVALCEKASFVGLRNRGSVHAVKALLPECLAEKVVFQPCTTTLIRKLYGAQIPQKCRTERIAFNLAFDREERRYGCHKDEICTAVARAAKVLEERGYKIVLVYHCAIDIQMKLYMEKCAVKFEEVSLSSAFPMEVYQFYNGIDCVLGMRGHAQMIPFGLNCEIISLGTHDKMRWFLEDIDATDWYVDLNEDSDTLTGKILEKFKTVHEDNGEKTRQRLLDAQERLWEITQSNMKQIMELLK